jgi:hypothetical protein
MRMEELRRALPTRDDVANVFGLQTRSSVGTFPRSLGMLGLGICLGFGAALLVAPKPGRELRKEIRSRANRAAERIGGEVPISSMTSEGARQG